MQAQKVPALGIAILRDTANISDQGQDRKTNMQG